MKNKVLRERAFLSVCIALGTAQVWISRYAMNQDGTSYLDVGDAYLRHDWASAISGYWSPMYPWLLGTALHLFKPSLWWESITVHVVNWAIYMMALFSFRFFLRSVLCALSSEDAPSQRDSFPLSDWILSGLGYAIFLWASLVLIDTGDVTPDLLVEAFLFLIGGYLVDLRSNDSYGKFAMFGIFCGAAYLAKAVMFPMGICLLAILLFSAKRSKRRVWGVLLAAMLFIVVSSPYIAALSLQKGRFTFGDSGKLTYAAMVNPNVPQKHWQGETTGGGMPQHPTRQLLEHPPVFEFAVPIGGTYPPWYDPSYWNEGAHGTFRLRAQTRAFVESLRKYTNMLLRQLGLLAGILIFTLWGGLPTRRGIRSNWPLILAAALIIGAYSLVLVTPRYVGGALVLLFVAILAGIRLPKNAQTGPLTRYVAIAMISTILFSVVAYLADTAYVTMTVYGFPTQRDQIKPAEGLQQMGLHDGDPVAVIGDGTVDYWARLARFKTVAEVFAPEPGRLQFWSESWERRKLVYECLRRSGAKIVVVWSPPPSGLDPGWSRIAKTNYYAHVLAE